MSFNDPQLWDRLVGYTVERHKHTEIKQTQIDLIKAKRNTDYTGNFNQLKQQEENMYLLTVDFETSYIGVKAHDAITALIEIKEEMTRDRAKGPRAELIPLGQSLTINEGKNKKTSKEEPAQKKRKRNSTGLDIPLPVLYTGTVTETT
jgi:hypothetical protein